METAAELRTDAKERRRHGRRQQRLLLSCSECRKRKIGCDRSKPCLACVRSNRVERCQYDASSAPEGTSTIPGQIVFSAVPKAHQQKVQPQPPPRSVSASAAESLSALSWSGSEDGQLRDQPSRAAAVQPVTVPKVQPPEDVASPLQLFWHGSRGVDQYVSPFDRKTVSVPKEVVFGEGDATVYWGRSHETNFIPRITDMTSLLLKSEDVSTLYHVERQTRPPDKILKGWDPELLSLVPPRDASDRFMKIYADHFESYYRILHMPSFNAEYSRFWSSRDVQDGPPDFLAQLLSICAIACCFTDEDRQQREQQVRTWLESVRLWLFKQDPRAQMTLGMLQAHLLMLLAGDVHWMKIDRSWISSGILVRNAISAGLHREPGDFVRISPFHAELRRRLWYSIMEYDLQAAFAKGRVPSVREEDYDCGLPSSTGDVPVAGTSSGSPQVSFLLAKSLGLRIKVCQAVNSVKLSLDYEEVLRLDSGLRGFLRASVAVLPNEEGFFKSALFKILSQRAVIALHAPFVARSLEDPRWVYSRSRCLATAESILYEALCVLEQCYFGSGDCGPFVTLTNICRCEISNSVFLICHELLTQAVEQRRLCDNAPIMPGAGMDIQHKEKLVDLVKRTSTATARVSKPDIVSQRTCAWMQLSAELCGAAAKNDGTTVSTMVSCIRSNIEAFRSKYPAQRHDETPLPQIPGDVRSPVPSPAFEGALDEDYFSLFLELNNMAGFE
ncbi:hypothetical protein VSDG_02889 [Cytospora chrysosperma]|uniref:Zn(2)-C6 fungal-type domain-containing protein n=1 Tax=Cytospora chrysosperma TaxID=252740 RepID=A0A423WCP6_CYTCH|nr:hypothetical protein VSDG_02889 [Valsa sordida]